MRRAAGHRRMLIAVIQPQQGTLHARIGSYHRIGPFACPRAGRLFAQERIPPELTARAGLQFRQGSYAERPGWIKTTLPDSPEPVYISPTIVIGSRDIQSVSDAGCTRYGCDIRITLTPHGGRLMLEFTGSHIGKPIAMLLDDQLLTFAMVNGPFGKHFEVGVADEKGAQALLRRVTRR